MAASRGLLRMLPVSGATLMLRAEPDARILVFTIGVALCTALLFGVTPALQATRQAGWRNVILSNHVPELPALVGALGLEDLIDGVYTSAAIGYDKPHPEAFRHALRESGDPARRWMVGDNPVADVKGAQALGIPALLVRTEGGEPDALAAAQRVIAS